MNLGILFNDDSNVAVSELKTQNLQEGFDSITQIRQKLFNGEPFFEIAREMMSMGILPHTNAGLPAEYCDISYIYSRIAKAEVRLTQLKNYFREQQRQDNMSEMEKVIEAAMHGVSKLKLTAPEWAI